MKIIFEDKYFLAIDKPSGLVVHGDGRTEEKSLVDWLEEYFINKGGGEAAAYQQSVGNPHTLDSGRYTARWGIVNRLDRDTSGIILIAKNEETFLNLQKQFIERSVVKEYFAQVWHNLNLENLEKEKKVFKMENYLYKILEPISRHKKDPRIWVCGTGVGERQTKRDAETDFEIINLGKSFTLVKLFPKTGRTHQLRLHCRFIGHPIIGDSKYGINGITNEHGKDQIKSVLENLNESEIEADKKSRLMLHAKSLEFIHPILKEKIKIETNLPDDFIFSL